jgi:hypothetical protein
MSGVFAIVGLIEGNIKTLAISAIVLFVATFWCGTFFGKPSKRNEY